MSRASSTLRRLERQAARRNPGRVLIVVSWDDPGYLTDADGRRWPEEEYKRQYPNDRIIVMTWGDGEEDEHTTTA